MLIATNSNPVRNLPPTARHVDESLARIDGEIDWLSQLSPVDSAGMWKRFLDSGCLREPLLQYSSDLPDIDRLRSELRYLPTTEVEDPLLRALFDEKQRECQTQLELVEHRGTPEAQSASCELFGGSRPWLKALAHRLLATTAAPQLGGPIVGATVIADSARAQFAEYRTRAPEFAATVIFEDDLDCQLMVSAGHLHIQRDLELPERRVEPLLAHEVGTHILTHFNGSQQPIRLLRTGLAGYDELQEGMGTFSEYLAGLLPPARLAELAARVIAAELALAGASVTEIFHTIQSETKLARRSIFDTAVRAKRGGALTKDALYLQGLLSILTYLSDGDDYEDLMLGKYALGHRAVIAELMERGWVMRARLNPIHLDDPAGRRRLERARRLTVQQLIQDLPPS